MESSKTAGQQFMEMTRYESMGPSEEDEKIIPQPPLTLDLRETLGAPGGAAISLPRPETLPQGHVDLVDTLVRRRTLRKYSPEPLSLEELSFLLWCTQGIKEISNRPVTFRPVPSAGARHAFETFLLINRVEGIEPGYYQYLAAEHALGLVRAEPLLAEQVAERSHKQSKIVHSAVTFVWVAVTSRMRWRYGQRGYRYLHLDAGHVCQNLYLAAEAIDAGVCAMAAFDDQALNSLLGLDGEELWVIYMSALGKRIKA